jgi:hypothetical protein
MEDIKKERTPRKIYFAEYNPKFGKTADETTYKIRYAATAKALHFPGKLIKAFDLEGKFIKLYTEQTRRIVGWKVESKLDLDEVKNGWRLVKINASGQYALSIQRIIKQFGLDELGNISLDLQEYVDNSLLEKNNKYMYVTFPKTDKTSSSEE